MLGEFVDDYTVRVIDVFAMPQSGTVSLAPPLCAHLLHVVHLVPSTLLFFLLLAFSLASSLSLLSFLFLSLPLLSLSSSLFSPSSSSLLSFPLLPPLPTGSERGGS